MRIQFTKTGIFAKTTTESLFRRADVVVGVVVIDLVDILDRGEDRLFFKRNEDALNLKSLQ